ncbi:MAG: hypothetical protein JKY37_10185 [Nannocystaceae bacterium]|nr:hypothetical protein [Nannocystaceae bacterium]
MHLGVDIQVWRRGIVGVWASAALSLVGVGCQQTPTNVYADILSGGSGGTTGDDPPRTDGSDTADDAHTADTGSASRAGHGSGSESGETFPEATFDVGWGGDAEAPPAAPCQTVDLLFIIDNSGSMGDEQLNLVASFSGFIDGIGALLGPATEYHVGVTTTDAYKWNAPQCQTLGGLTVRTGGELSSDQACGPFVGGGSFITIRDDLADAFSCAARVGIDGAGIERPMDALAGVLADPLGDTAECNRGFLREDALLVIVLITDEEDEGDSEGDPLRWHELVLEAKGYDEDAVVVLSLIGHDKPNACIATQWTGMMGAEISPRLIEFTERFVHGTVGDVCAPDYTDAFASAVDGIAQACGLAPTPSE